MKKHLAVLRDSIGDLICSLGLILALPLLRVLARRNFLQSSQIFRRILDAAGLAIVPHHYYTPVVTPDDITRDLGTARSLPGLQLDANKQLALIGKFKYQSELKMFPMTGFSPGKFHYDNNLYGPGDAEFLYSLIRHLKPGRIIEIGGGFSTLIAHAALKKNAEEVNSPLAVHTCIEPYPEPWLLTAGPEIMIKKVEDCPVELFKTLQDEDILLIDSSHVIRPQGDVLYEYQQIVPNLNAGVYVHAHDVFTPYDYPEAWILKARKLWNEQYLMESFLCYNSEFEVVCALNWLKKNYFRELAEVFPVLARTPDADPGAFWFRRKPAKRQ